MEDKPQTLSIVERENPSGASKNQEVPGDVTGRERLVRNVLFSWGAHTVFIVAGFILPRVIDRRLGQERLGVWDFCWSLVTYFQLVQMGIASSVNRYVAAHRAAKDIAGVNRVVSSATFLLGAAGLLAMGLTLGASLLLPALFTHRLGENVGEAQWVVFLLGMSVCIQISFSVFGGVLTGCHRWELHNINRSGWHALTVAGMVLALLLGKELRTLAAVLLAGEILSDLRLLVLAHRICYGLRLRLSSVRWRTIQDLFVFGGKTLVPGVSKMLLDQTTSLLVMSYLGPAALAVYSRPRSLVYQLDVLVRKMATTLVPVTSSLQGIGDVSGIRDLLIKSTRYAFYMALPMVLTLVFFGGPIMRFWMGSHYADGRIPAILAGGYLAVLIQLPALCILAGLNAHGRAGMGRLVASLCSVGLNIIVLKYLQWGLVGTAVAVSLPLAILNIVDIPLLLCRRVGLSYRRYFLSVAVGPAVHLLPFAVCLVVARVIFESQPLTGLAGGGIAATVTLGIMYWQYVLPHRIRTGMVRVFYAGLRSLVLRGAARER